MLSDRGNWDLKGRAVVVWTESPTKQRVKILFLCSATSAQCWLYKLCMVRMYICSTSDGNLHYYYLISLFSVLLNEKSYLRRYY